MGEIYKVGQKWNSFVWLSVELLLRTIYCANPRTKPDSQSRSLYHRGLGRRAPWIIREYNLATDISIRPLTQPCTYEMGYSIFAAMSRLKYASTTRASFPSMPPTKRKYGEKCFCCSWQLLQYLYFFSFSHWARSIFIGSFLWVSHSG